MNANPLTERRVLLVLELLEETENAVASLIVSAAPSTCPHPPATAVVVASMAGRRTRQSAGDNCKPIINTIITEMN